MLGFPTLHQLYYNTGAAHLANYAAVSNGLIARAVLAAVPGFERELACNFAEGNVPGVLFVGACGGKVLNNDPHELASRCVVCRTSSPGYSDNLIALSPFAG